MKTDIEIARSVRMKPIADIARQMGIDPEDLEMYGKYKAKVPLKYIDRRRKNDSRLILVTAISPTPAGEGKTTVSIGLSQALNRIGKRSCVVLREPSLGPVFGIKGGATGGGFSQVLPMEEINLHFTGDFAAIEKAHNLLAALIDNNLQSKTRSLGLDPRTIAWKRVMDMNDRAVRDMVIGLGGMTGGVPRETGFDITAASEVMAILCLASGPADLKRRLGNIFVGFTYDKKPIYARDLHAEGAMAALLKDAIKPNLVQTIEGTPALIHGGPFANIAQGTNTVLATEMSLSLTDYTVTEAGFGCDLGAEKFLDIKCRAAGLAPNAVVLVATVRALKYHGGQPLAELKTPNVEALERGIENLQKHIENVGLFNLTPVVAINRFVTDSDEELQFIKDYCTMRGVACAVANVWGEGGAGTEELARLVVEATESGRTDFRPLYPLDESVEKKVETVARGIYGADGVEYTPKAKQALKRIADLGLTGLAVCIAKTQKSLSDNPALLGRPRGFTITVRDIEIAAGAGFLVPITGEIMRMPGLPEVPAAEAIDIDDEGNISGLF
ncbi:formate--tetrahydrofolate ligase [uncultured Rikenella sp.]|uniref:formate--tetrahydrofolate ligase n=1 Tax=uncultured Rikenella sp. TaxID=368003 RepID=UPI0025D59A93|nr:formate--tetrahydrofolate ligase [uncultured Rikenella sp.]